ncbi:MAG: hypothetical protein J7L71_08975 [Spirochaetaceae bacterium]|nr:hypothetical protein [Spirochaetaceae bacterium]
MNKLPQKTFLIVIIFYLAAFIVFFTYSIYSYASINVTAKTLENISPHGLNMDISIHREKPDSQVQILSNFKISWIINNSFKLFISYLIPVHITALIIAFSLLFPWKLGAPGMQTAFVDVIGKSIFLFLILTLIYTGLTEGLLPVILQKQSEQNYLTEIAVDYFDKAKIEIDKPDQNKDFSGIVKMLNAFLQIDPGSPVVLDTIKWAKSRLDVKTEQAENKSEEPSTKKTPGAADLIIKAGKYFNNEDYFSALYYADMAYKLDNSRRDAQRIAAESQEAIRSQEPKQSERDAKNTFQMKREGFNFLESGDPISAYYTFKKLSETETTDQDIQEFLNQSLKAISNKAFFTDEAEKFLTAPGINNITFLNDKETLIHISKMILINEKEAYFFNIEVVKFDSSNSIVKHFLSDYGKYTAASKSIIMYAIDRDDPAVNHKPVYLKGEDSSPDNIILKINPNLFSLQFLGQPLNVTKSMNVFTLFKYAPIFEKFGYLSDPVNILILERILKPFTFLLVSFFSVSLGWFLRIRKFSFPWFAIILIPIITLLIYNLLSVYEYAMSLFLGFVLLQTGFYQSLVFLLISQALLLFISMVSIASQKN